MFLKDPLGLFDSFKGYVGILLCFLLIFLELIYLGSLRILWNPAGFFFNYLKDSLPSCRKDFRGGGGG